MRLFGRGKVAPSTDFIAALDLRIRSICLEEIAKVEARRSQLAQEAFEREMAKTPEQIRAEMAALDEEWESRP